MKGTPFESSRVLAVSLWFAGMLRFACSLASVDVRARRVHTLLRLGRPTLIGGSGLGHCGSYLLSFIVQLRSSATVLKAALEVIYVALEIWEVFSSRLCITCQITTICLRSCKGNPLVPLTLIMCDKDVLEMGYLGAVAQKAEVAGTSMSLIARRSLFSIRAKACQKACVYVKTTLIA